MRACSATPPLTERRLDGERLALREEAEGADGRARGPLIDRLPNGVRSGRGASALPYLPRRAERTMSTTLTPARITTTAIAMASSTGIGGSSGLRTISAIPNTLSTIRGTPQTGEQQPGAISARASSWSQPAMTVRSGTGLSALAGCRPHRIGYKLQTARKSGTTFVSIDSPNSAAATDAITVAPALKIRAHEIVGHR